MSHIGGDTDNHKTEEKLIPPNNWGEIISASVTLIEQNRLDIENKIAPCKPRIIGVTKYFGPDAIINGYRAGIRDFGESRAIEAIRKIESLPEEIRNKAIFHFIGHLQTNKVEKVVEYFKYIHSVDSLKLAKVISETACRLNKRVNILLQVDNAKEEQKFGYDTKVLQSEFHEILNLEGINIIGLMNMAPLEASDEELRKTFGDLRKFKEHLEKEHGITLPELSMGMSNDFAIATKEGATMIRVGRKLFN